MPRGEITSEPFRVWADNYVAVHGTLHLGDTFAKVQRRAHEQCCVEVATVDRFFTAVGEPHQLAILYPLDEPAHDRWCENCHDVVTTNDDLVCPWCESDTAP